MLVSVFCKSISFSSSALTSMDISCQYNAHYTSILAYSNPNRKPSAQESIYKEPKMASRSSIANALASLPPAASRQIGSSSVGTRCSTAFCFGIPKWVILATANAPPRIKPSAGVRVQPVSSVRHLTPRLMLSFDPVILAPRWVKACRVGTIDNSGEIVVFHVGRDPYKRFKQPFGSCLAYGIVRRLEFEIVSHIVPASGSCGFRPRS